jgi:hypothetical protein
MYVTYVQADKLYTFHQIQMQLIKCSNLSAFLKKSKHLSKHEYVMR